MLRKISDKVLDFFGFFEENQDVSFMIGGIALIIVLIIVFIGLRAKMRNQGKVLQKARIGEEKYRILAEISNDILFEYDIFSDEMTYTDKFMENFGRKGQIERFAEIREEAQYVYKEDITAFENFCKLLQCIAVRGTFAGFPFTDCLLGNFKLLCKLCLTHFIFFT